jgi:invasion protein IalB
MVDQGQSMNAPYISCVRTGCIADYEASKELIGQLKRGQGLVVEGINTQGQVVSFVLPLFDFAKAYDGPPTDSKSFEEQP